jgi:hypothetical protein
LFELGDDRIWVPAGAHKDRNIHYTTYKYRESMPTERHTRHQVFLAHAANVLIDEQYFFQHEADARWFWKELQGTNVCCWRRAGKHHAYDRMALWVNDRLEAERSYPRN